MSKLFAVQFVDVGLFGVWFVLAWFTGVGFIRVGLIEAKFVEFIVEAGFIGA